MGNKMDRKELENRNQKIIDAVLRKEKSLCPGAIALIGIYGSFQTGDIHPLSDLDLLILINDDRGWQLAEAFIQEDAGIGYDIYCTSWESLEEDATYEHPHISKLMDAQIVYCADEKYRNKLELLRSQVRRILTEPFCEKDCLKAEKTMNEAMRCFALAMTEDDLAAIRRQAGGVLYFVENAVAMLNKTYFRKGVGRRFEELNAMIKKPKDLCKMIDGVVAAETAGSLKEQLTKLIKEMNACLEEARQELASEKQTPAEILPGTYEEMYSNWHGKMSLALKTGDRHLAFMTLSSLNEMIEDIRNQTHIGILDVLSVYDPKDLKKTAEEFDQILQKYSEEYTKAGLKPVQYRTIDDFVSGYLRKGSE